MESTVFCIIQLNTDGQRKPTQRDAVRNFFTQTISITYKNVSWCPFFWYFEDLPCSGSWRHQTTHLLGTTSKGMFRSLQCNPTNRKLTISSFSSTVSFMVDCIQSSLKLNCSATTLLRDFPRAPIPTLFWLILLVKSKSLKMALRFVVLRCLGRKKKVPSIDAFDCD